MPHNSRCTTLRRLRQKGDLTIWWERGAQNAKGGLALEAQVYIGLSAALELQVELALLTLDFFVDLVVAAHAVEDAGYGYAHGGGRDVVVDMRLAYFEGWEGRN